MEVADKIREIVEHIEQLKKQKENLDKEIKNVLGYAKGCGFNPKIIQAVVRRREAKAKGKDEQKFLQNEARLLQKMSDEDREEYQYLYNMYCEVLDI